MKDDTRKHSLSAEKTIEAVLKEFLEEQRKRLKPATMRKYEDVIHLFRSSMDGYAYQSLDEQESALFDRLYNANGDEHREFCQVFGPEKIPENVGEFLDYFMVRKVACGKGLMQAAGTVIKKLGKWLKEKGYVDSEDAGQMTDRGATAAKELPATEDLAYMLAEYADYTAVSCAEVLEDHFTVVATEPGKLHLSQFLQNDRITISVPGEISDACRTGWSISGALGKSGSGWHILDVWNVYP